MTSAPGSASSPPGARPAPAIQALNREIRALVEQPEMTARFATMGGIAASGPVEDFAAFVAAETEKWRSVIRREGLQMDVG
jgi:tripartite-type tricarboxylate transporter receptor subunit TctC